MQDPPRSDRKKVKWNSAVALYRRLWPFLRPEKRLTLAVGLLMVVVVPSGVISPLLVRRIFDETMPAGDVQELVLLGLLIAALTLLSAGLGYVQSLLSLSLHNRVKFRIVSQLFEHVLRLPLRYLDRTESGALMSRVRDDAGSLQGLMSDTLVEAGVSALKAILFFVLLLQMDAGLALSGFALVAVIFALVLVLSRPLRRRSEKAREADAASSAALHESLAGMATIRTTARAAAERGRFLGSVKSALRASARREVLGAATGASFSLILTLGGYVIVAVGAYRILMGYSTFGSLLAFFLYLTQLTASAGSVFGLLPALQRGLASWERILAILDEPAEATEHAPADGGLTLRGAVEFREVSFRYDEETLALAGIQLQVEPGEVIALVGRSGAGKSTLVHLLPRLYEPTQGAILLDGRPLTAYPLEALRRRIGVVPQDVFLFNRSIRENIAYATPGASEEQIRDAAAAAHADSFIRALPAGYDTIVGERGVRLSGGEKQRLAIAREFLRDPPLLILDEATSNLDSESEALVREAMARLMAGRTCFVIAHRLSTIQSADRIVVLDRGRIVESGSHRELLQRDGLYAELHRLQALVGAD